MPRLGNKVLLLLVLDVLLLAACLWHPKYLMSRARVPFLVKESHGSIVIDEILDSLAAPGLARGFTILTINGNGIREFYDADFLADLRAIGDTLQVHGSDGGKEFTATVRLIPFFSLRYAIISLLIGVITLALAIFVLLARPQDRTARVLHAALACMAFGVMLMWGAAPRGDPWTIASRVGFFIFYIGAASNFLYFTLLFPPRSHELTRFRGALLQLPAVLVAVMALSTHLLALLRESLDIYRLFRHFFDLYHGTILVYAVLGVGNFIRSYRTTKSPEERKKLQWLLWGLAIGPAPFLLLEILPELFIPLSPIPEEYTLVFLLIIPCSLAASFARHHLLDIRFVINRTTVYGIVVGGFVLAYLGAVAVAAAIVGQYTVGASVVSAVLVALAFEPMRRQVQHLVDRYFFRVHYDFRRAQREFVDEMKNRSTAVDLARCVVDQVQRLIPISRVAFVMTPPEGEKPVCLAEAPVRQFDGQPEFLGEVHSWVVEDKPYGIPEKIEPGVPILPVDPAKLESVGLVLLVPMFSGSNSLLGLLALGGKKSGARFSGEDMDLLRSVAAQAGFEIDRIMLQREVFRKEMEAQRLRDLNELKSAFVSNVSHEFHTPLTSIKLFAELLRSSPTAKDAKSREFLTIIEGEADRLDQMVTTILDSTRIEKGIRVYAMQECDMGAIVRSVLRTMRYQLRKAGFTVRTAGLSPGRRYPVRVDRAAIIEVLINLIGNAIKYSGSRRALTIGLSAVGRHVKCTVRDRGEGIPSEALRHIFERYYRAPSLDKKAGGIGLGLPLARSTMEALGGRIEAESVVGKGSCFTVWIPRAAENYGRRLRSRGPSGHV